MASGILYLDSGRDRSVRRALSRHGRVWHVPDINRAMFIMAERDFEYYFVDADTPQAHAFLMHLRHDPQLPPPKAVVLLSGNDEEDCEAWRVDAFVTKSRISLDAPYIFSHLRGTPGDEAGVIRIAPAVVSKGFSEARPDNPRGRLRETGVPGGAAPIYPVDPPESGGEGRADADAGIAGLRKKKAESEKPAGSRTRTGKVPYKVIGVAFLLAAVGLWLFTLGPLAGSSKSGGEKRVTGSVEAGTSRKASKSAGTEAGIELDAASEAEGRVAPDVTTGNETTQPVQPAVADTSTIAAPAAAQPGSENPGPYTAPAPPEQPANRPPAASISGPDQVVHGETAVFNASADDPDGDSVSLSWTSKNMCWSTPGLFTVTVTATDGRGASSNSSKSVRVI